MYHKKETFLLKFIFHLTTVFLFFKSSKLEKDTGSSFKAKLTGTRDLKTGL